MDWNGVCSVALYSEDDEADALADHGADCTANPGSDPDAASDLVANAQHRHLYAQAHSCYFDSNSQAIGPADAAGTCGGDRPVPYVSIACVHVCATVGRTNKSGDCCSRLGR
jgi:hypothetical protein